MNKFAIVVSEFNKYITEALLQGSLAKLQQANINTEWVQVVWVPGAVEIPFTAQLLAKTKRYQAIICLGAVIRGETDHYDYVCQQVSYGCQRVMLDHDLPVIFGILTTDNEDQAQDRLGGKHGHKGEDAAEAALRMVEVVKNL